MPATYVISTRKTKDGHFTAEPGPAQYLRVADTALTYGPQDRIRPADWLAEVTGSADANPNPVSISPMGDVLVFVHGYNNGLNDVLRATRELNATLTGQGWRGVVVAFDWPSANSVLNYAEDRSDAAAVAVLLVRGCLSLLVGAQAQGCKTNVHLIGHSTGAYVILEAFARAQDVGRYFKADWRIGQVALISGDISAASLSASADWSKPMFGRILRLTNYSNGHDAVLAASNAKRLGVSPRVGRVGLPPDANAKAVNVDCTRHFESLTPGPDAGLAFCHSWQFTDPKFGLDLAMTLEGATDRHAIPTRLRGAEGLSLRQQDVSRPEGQANWGIKDAARIALLSG